MPLPFRQKRDMIILVSMPACRNGRRGRLKICWWQHRMGSSPIAGSQRRINMILRFLFFFLYLNLISCFFHFFANHLLWINCYKIVTIHLCLANTDVTGHHATGKGGRKYVFQIH